MLRVILIMILLAGSGTVSATGSNVWLLIDTSRAELSVKRGLKTMAILKHIAIGRKGAGYKQGRGDDITPLGKYRIGWVNEKSRYRRFFGLTYPSTLDAKLALTKGTIDSATYGKIISAQNNNKVPPQDTALGGQIGIHGLGKADASIHDMFNWTHGCIALTNRQIDYLSRWVKPGMLVEVK